MDLIVNIFNTIFQMSIMVGVISVIILGIRFILGKKLNTSHHQVLWIIILVKCLVPYTPESSLSIMNYTPQFQEQKKSITNSSWDIQRIFDNENISNSASAIEQLGYSRELPISETSIKDSGHINLFKENVHMMVSQKNPWQRFIVFIAIIWVIGCVSMLLGLAYINYTVHNKAKAYPIDDRYNEIINRCKIQLNSLY